MNNDTLLYCQIHPAWEQRGEVTSQAFSPTRKDNCGLSVYDGDMISPVKAWQHYTVQLAFASVGVVAITVTECNTQELEVRCDTQQFQEHAIIDFGTLTRNTIKRKAQNLKDATNTRGWSFRPDPITS